MSDALSSRIRPNSEAAPWVVEEVRTIERELTAAISAEEDWHRWAREVLIDWNVQFDDHKAGLRLAMVQLIKDRSAALTAAIERAERAEHELVEAKADAESWRQQSEMHMQTSLAQAERAEKAENTADLMRDEFQRIIARCVDFDGLSSTFTRQIVELCQRAKFVELCQRAKSEIEQRVTVVVQRDEAQRKSDKLERELDDAIRSVRYLRCSRHIMVPKLNAEEFNGGECGACIAEQRDQWREVAGMLAFRMKIIVNEAIENGDIGYLKERQAIESYDDMIAKEKAVNNE